MMIERMRSRMSCSEHFGRGVLAVFRLMHAYNHRIIPGFHELAGVLRGSLHLTAV
jgi:hypothetical protein